MQCWRSEGSVASHTTEEQQRNAPVSASKNGTLAVSASLSRKLDGSRGWAFVGRQFRLRQVLKKP